MKKYSLILCCLLLITGCGEKKTNHETFSYQEDHYQIAFPYRLGVGENYSLSSYDVDHVDQALMNLSSEYFKINNSIYQMGQYLPKEELKTLLDSEHYNRIDPITVNQVTIKPNYLISVREQNYLSTTGVLKGISLALVLEPYQPYQNSYGATLYHEIDHNTLIQFGKQKAQELVHELKQKEGMKEIRVLVGLYVNTSPNAVLPGTFESYGITTSDSVTWTERHDRYQYLDQENVMETDINTYTNFQTLKRKISEQIPNIYVTGIGLYEGQVLKKIDMSIQNSNCNASILLGLSKILTEQVPQLFPNVVVRITVKESGQTKAFFIKESGLELKTYFMEG